ncbi:hypothetical protein PRO82_001388 [Candidatus Protochlamydia amoebophila]|nr:hypothetical protein [Candidatus Protochlamydia amoebophila]
MKAEALLLIFSLKMSPIYQAKQLNVFSEAIIQLILLTVFSQYGLDIYECKQSK